MVARVFMLITWVCRAVVLWYKVCNIFWTDAIPTWSVHRLFSPQGFATFVGHISPYRCTRNFQSCWIIKHIHTAFSITFLTQFVKKRPSTPWSFLGLSSNVLTLLLTICSLMNHSDVFNNLAISLTKWPEYRKNRCLSCSKNSVCLHFRERVEKTKENGENTKMENLQNEQEKYAWKKTRVRAHWGKR